MAQHGRRGGTVVTKRKPAQTFPLWDYVYEELTERGQTIEQLAEACYCGVTHLVSMLRTSEVDCLTCEYLAEFFGTSFGLWHNLALEHSGIDPCGI